MPAAIETDYLVVGSGAVGLAFADELLAHTDADIVIVDRHGKPGGHWNDAYAFVALHQPSAFYGVNSMALGSGHKDAIGTNAGLYELASGPEVSGYFDAVMRQRLLPSGRVRYFPMSDYDWNGRFTSLLSGAETEVVAKKTVDATYFQTSVPATHTPKFEMGEGVRLVTPNALPHLWLAKGPQSRRFVILGAGKTAMDTGVWLLGAGADPAAITWIVPRDSWLLNRARVQPGNEFFRETMGGQAAQMRAFAQGESVDDIFLRLEEAGTMLRIDCSRAPTMFHYATMSEGEVETLRRITNIVRMGRVESIGCNEIVLEQGRVLVEPDTLFIDCTASAVAQRPTVPMFQGDRITPQMARIPQPAFSAALVAWIEAHYDDDDAKNALCRPVGLPYELVDYPMTNIINMMNQVAWGQDARLRDWMVASRLDGFAKTIAALSPDDVEGIALLKELRANGMTAIANLQRLAALR